MYSLAIKKYLEDCGFEALCPKAVLFDMDGVLYDSMPNHAIAWQESMARFGIHMTADDAYATEGARGVDTIRIMVKRQLGKDIDEAEAQRMYDVKTEIFHSLPEAPVMPGVKELMQKITESGILCCVVTGSAQRPLIQRIHQRISVYFPVNIRIILHKTDIVYFHVQAIFPVPVTDKNQIQLFAEKFL
jgi:beta-phosphoglucomutase-like phosphatase (HAD superfamily)